MQTPSHHENEQAPKDPGMIDPDELEQGRGKASGQGGRQEDKDDDDVGTDTQG